MNNPHVERAQGHAYYAQHEHRGLTERQVDAALAQAEATLAIVYELQQNRMQAEQGPSHTGAAPFTSGDAVTVTNPRHEWYGATGRVHAVGDSHSSIDFSGEHNALIDNSHLEKADDK